MILNRIGNKSKIAAEIIKHFPQHTSYVELFFGAGGLFFNKPKARFNILNDIDSDVYNLFVVLKMQKEAFVNTFINTPIHLELFEYWRKNKETDPVQKAVRFIFLSNFSLMGSGRTLRYGNNNTKKIILDNVEATFRYINDCQFMNFCFRKALNKIEIKKEERNGYFIYADGPYLHTGNNYSHGFNEQDSLDLFTALQASDLKFAMSEEDHPFILDQARKNGLNIVPIGERRSIKKRSMEVLITNYSTNHPTLFN